ncbi:hypothetical protein BC941DRAFT_447673 [Chlamydoabsidia padenii]|nr:hypothetical protein BC941DRAFT_447673 [Chlamydoabsidia padenii]
MPSSKTSPTRFRLECHLCKNGKMVVDRKHLESKHDLTLVNTFTGRSPPTLASSSGNALVNGKSYFICSCCASYQDTLEQIGEHVKIHLDPASEKQQEDNDKNKDSDDGNYGDEESESGGAYRIITVPEKVTVPGNTAIPFGSSKQVGMS